MKLSVLCALGENVKIEALKKAVAEADKKAAAEQALREKHEARVIEAERDLGAESSRERIRTRPSSPSRRGCSRRSPRCSEGHSGRPEGCGW